MSKYDEIRNWIIQQLELPKQKLSFHNLLFVAGNTGIGKTHRIQAICKELNLDVLSISTHNCISANELTDIITKNITSKMLQILQNNIRKKIIIIDEFESMMAIDRSINNTLLSILSSNKLSNVPIICISSLEIIKKIGVIKKKCKIIELPDPSNEEIHTILQELYPGHSKEHLFNIASQCNGNISHCIQNLDNKIYQSIDRNANIGMLYSTCYNRELIKRVILTDPWLIPMRFHENLISELKQRKSTITMTKTIYKVFMGNFIYFDYMMIHSIDIASDIFASMIHILSTLPLKKNAISNAEGFTKILSYLSLQKKYIKNAYAANIINFPLYQIGNYHNNISGRNFYVLKLDI
jgi:nucleoside-triphosphatase THEP1